MICGKAVAIAFVARFIPLSILETTAIRATFRSRKSGVCISIRLEELSIPILRLHGVRIQGQPCRNVRSDAA